MTNRLERLDDALRRVTRAMHLRRPQQEALDALHAQVRALGADISDIGPAGVVGRLRQANAAWTFRDDLAQFTFAVATGVGKTRLMGAIMAYLYLAGQSANFLLLASRAAILRKLEEECLPSSAKYIFVDPSLVPESRICHRANLEGFRPEPATADLFARGPTLYVLSPQSLDGDDKRAARASEFSGISLVGHLRSCRDLVVLADEAHHLGGVAEAVSPAWTQAIRHVQPCLQLGMTATPRQEAGVNVLYTYDLRTCLRERLYTKDVRLIVGERPKTEEMPDRDWDRQTLRFALERLARKEAALAAYGGERPFPPIRPVLLVCAQDTKHADEVARWLKEEVGLAASEVLVSHSKRTEREEDIARLVAIERPESRVRVVVNVYELTEGWDVTNVYVVAPLRAMGTFSGALQTMGRGLRLPAGHRVGDPELDRLDVLCFGKETLRDILDAAVAQFAEQEDGDIAVEVREHDQLEPPPKPCTTTLRIRLAAAHELAMPRARRRPAEPDLDFDVASNEAITARYPAEFDLALHDVVGTVEEHKYEHDTFVRMVAARVIAGLSYLSDPLHRESVEELVRGLLARRGFNPGVLIPLDWMRVTEITKRRIDEPYRKQPATFEATASAERIAFGDFEWHVPDEYASLNACPRVEDVHSATWQDALHARLPIRGWKRCTHQAAAFDSSAEFHVAWILDQSAEVTWWLRNDPACIRIATPIGNYAPDFVFLRGGRAIVILEVKGTLFWTPDSDATVKARATEAWCQALAEAAAKEGPGQQWSYWLILDEDAHGANTLQDLELVRVQPEAEQAVGGSVGK